jgi:Arc/MetJ family transcription regulator
MRTTLDLPDDLLSEAMRLSKVRTKTGAVILSLQELINRRKIERLRKLKGKLDLDIDLDSLRRDRTPS